MFAKFKNIIIFSALVTLLSVILFSIESNKVELKIDNSKLPLNNSRTYAIGPTISRYHLIYVDTNIPLKIKLNDANYGLISFFEDMKALVLPEKHLSISFKRIAELKTWNKKLLIIKNARNSKELKSWWNPYQTNPLTIINNDDNKFGSWESFLARYFISTEKYIRHIKSQNKDMKNALAMILRFSLRENQLNVNQIIYNSRHNDKDKEYLQVLSDSVFNDLNSQIDKLVPNYNPIVHSYDLSKIKMDREYGIYNISLNKPNATKFDWGKTQLQGKILESLQPTDDSKSKENILFKNVEITPDLDSLTFSLVDIKNSARGDWISEINQTNKKYQYVLDLKEINPEIAYVLDLTYKTKYPVDIIIEEQQGLQEDNDQIIWNRTNMAFKDILLSPNYPGHYQRKIPFAFNDKLIKQKVILESEKPLSKDFFEHLKLQIFPIFESYITLSKTAHSPNLKIEINTKKIKENVYLANLENLSLEEEKKIKKKLEYTYWITKENHNRNTTILTIIFWPPVFIKIILFICGTIAAIKLIYENCLKQLLKRNKEASAAFSKKIKSSFSFLSIVGNLAYSKFRKTRLALFIIVISIILADILLTKFAPGKLGSLTITYVVIILWLITLVGYRGKIILSLYISLVLFIIFSIMLIVDLPVLSERILTWFYVFLLFGSVHGLIESCIKRDRAYEATNLTLAIKPRFLSLFSTIQKALKHSVYLLDKLLIIISKILDVLNFFIRQLYIKLPKPRFLNYYQSHIKLPKPRFLNYYQNVKTNLNKSIRYSAKSTLILITVIIAYLITLTMNAGLNSLNLKLHTTKESRNPVVQNFEPRIVYKSIKVIIRGREFGWKHEGAKLISNFGKVETEFWSDQKIIFTTPLSWHTGEISLRIEKPTFWDGKSVLVKSKEIKLKLLPITSSFTDEDDEFYEQMELSDKETRGINGYE